MTMFFNLLRAKDKETEALKLLQAVRCSSDSENIYARSPKELANIPGTPFAYWISDRVIDLYRAEKFDNESKGRLTRCGLGTLDDFRFLRTFWEVQKYGGLWVNYFHGGVFSRFYDNFYLLVRWGDAGKEIKSFVESKVGSASRKVQGSDQYFKPGFVFPRRTKAFSPKFMPSGGIFSTGGQAGFSPPAEILNNVGLLSSKAVSFLISLSQGRTGDAAQFEVGLVKRLPWPDGQSYSRQVERLAYESWRLRRNIDTTNEVSLAFIVPKELRTRLEDFDVHGMEKEIAELQTQIDDIALKNFGIRDEDCVFAGESLYENRTAAVLEEERVSVFAIETASVSESSLLLSWCVGVAFGRFDWRLATGERDAPPEPEPFDPLPVKSPGMLPDGAEPFHRHPGILVDDSGHPDDLPRLISDVLERVDAPVDDDLRRWLRRDFFKYHLQQYSKSRRKAPIYWPLATASGSYTLWLYYPELSDQTLFTAVNDYVEPKLKQVQDDLATLRSAGSNRSKAQESELETLDDFAAELADLRDTLLQIAPGYKPNQDDGVQITAAPLWPLFRHKPWQKILKALSVKVVVA